MKQVILRWFDCDNYSVLRDPTKPFDDNNNCAEAHGYFWRVWGDEIHWARSVVAGVRLRASSAIVTWSASRVGPCLEENKLEASEEVVRQLREAGVDAVVRKAENGR